MKISTYSLTGFVTCESRQRRNAGKEHQYNSDSEMVEVTGIMRDEIGWMTKGSGGCGEYSGIKNGVVCIVYSGTCMVVCGANKPLVRQIWAGLGGNNDILK